VETDERLSVGEAPAIQRGKDFHKGGARIGAELTFGRFEPV
jgi:hypothetical protein